jgi:hypothetical protein
LADGKNGLFYAQYIENNGIAMPAGKAFCLNFEVPNFNGDVRKVNNEAFFSKLRFRGSTVRPGASTERLFT